MAVRETDISMCAEAILGYGLPDPSWRKRRNRRRILIALLVLLAAFVASTISWDTETDSCAECGTIKWSKHFSILGFDVEYNARVDKGKIASLLDPITCHGAHKWEMASSTTGSVLELGSGVRASGRGLGRLLALGSVEYDHGLQEAISKCEKDPGCVRELTRAVQKGDLLWFQDFVGRPR